MITSALDALRSGRPIVVVDHEDRENEGDLILAAEFASPETIGFMIRHTSGVLCVALPGETCDRLDLPPMIANNQDPKGTAYTVSVDAKEGITTGISATERARTIRLLSEPLARPYEFTRPGHVFPLRAHPAGVHGRPGHTEAAVDLVRLAGLNPAGVIAEIVDDQGEPLRGQALRSFAEEHKLPFLTIDQVIEATPQKDPGNEITKIAEAVLPTAWGNFVATAFRGKSGEHVALQRGSCQGEVLLRIHSECLTGDAFGSFRCDCGPQLHHALERIDRAENGLVIYLKGHEGRGIGLANKIKAYQLQDQGLDTVDANLKLGFPADARDWSDAVAILRELRIASVRLMTNNPAKIDALRKAGIRVVQEAHEHGRREENEQYLITKAERLAHSLTMRTA